MANVPVSEYRAHMRAWHDRARAGEAVVVTEHGQPVVRVVGAEGESLLERLVRDGVLRRGHPRRPAADLPRIVAGQGDSADQISRDRDR